MNSPFPGFPPEALKFLRALKRHNDREWFQPRKPEFERVLRDPMLALLDRINGHLIRFAPDYCTEPAKAIFRIIGGNSEKRVHESSVISSLTCLVHCTSLRTARLRQALIV